MISSTISRRSSSWTADEVQYWLHNRFDSKTPAGWEKKAIRSIERKFRDEEAREAIFWDKWFVRTMLFFTAAVMGSTLP